MESVCPATTQISAAELTRPTADAAAAADVVAAAVAAAVAAISTADTHAVAAAYAPRTTSA